MDDDLLFVSPAVKEMFFPSRPEVHPMNANRHVYGEYHRTFQEIRQYEERFYRYMRMKTETFDYILSEVQEVLTKQRTNFKDPIGPEQKLVITLR